ncbi:MAG: cryptochrome/photolyase family protein, partial [Vampirovibrionales bacterium]
DERWEPHAKQQQTHVAQWASDAGVNFYVHNTSVLQHPAQRKNKQGNPFQVFTPFWKHSLPLLHEEATAPISPPASLPRLNELTTLTEVLQALQALPCAVPLEALGLRPRLPWYPSLMSHWQAGEAGAEALLKQFLAHAVYGYKEDRNVPSVAGTSKLSPYLQVGAISPWRVFHAVHTAFAERGLHDSATHYISELGWREFSHHLLEHFPHTPTHPLRPEFSQFPWEENPEVLERWQSGQTGVPIVDAGMRELYATGWMHNRTRMIVASYLVKNLQQHWLAGARWFWDTLIDADLAQNTQGWQWTAGCGADAAPYFRIFNPVLQGQKFDSAGHYVKHWVPELANLNAKDVHTPWEVKPALLRMDGVTLGDTYPTPLVDLNESRQRAL